MFGFQLGASMPTENNTTTSFSDASRRKSLSTDCASLIQATLLYTRSEIMAMIECDIHGLQGAPHISPDVLYAMKNKNPSGIIYLTLYLEGSEDDGSGNYSEEEKKSTSFLFVPFLLST